MEIQEKLTRIRTLPLLPMRGVVVFPHTALHFDVGRPKSLRALNEAMGRDQYLFLSTQKDMTEDDPGSEGMSPVGVVACVRQVLRLPGEGVRIMVEGQYRARIREYIQTEPYHEVSVKECLERRPADPLRRAALTRECQAAFEAYAALNPSAIPDDMAMRVAGQEDPGLLADDLAANLPLPPEERLRVLSSLSVDKRVELLLGILKREIDILSLERSIEKKVQEQVDQNQKEYYLREQLKAITGELGDGENPQEEAEEYRRRVLELKLGEEAEKTLLKECDRLFKMPAGSTRPPLSGAIWTPVWSSPGIAAPQINWIWPGPEKYWIGITTGWKKSRSAFWKRWRCAPWPPTFADKCSVWRDRLAWGKPPSPAPLPPPWAANTSGYPWAACGMRRISAVIGKRILAQCRDVS